jgi:hypothetical protein
MPFSHPELSLDLNCDKRNEPLLQLKYFEILLKH